MLGNCKIISTATKVSIIIPTKDRWLLLAKTIESVRSQTYGNWEAIIVDDNSTDETAEQVLALSKADPRFHLIKRTGNFSGAPICRNQGFLASAGDYIIFLDSDDCLAPFCLENRVKSMVSHPNLDFGVFPCQLFRNQPGDVELLWNADTPESDLDRFLHLHDVPWQTTSPIWRRQALNKIGLWDESLPRWQDWELHFRALCKGLKYKKFRRPDCFWRLPSPDRKTIASQWTPEHTYAIEQLLFRVHTMLIKSYALNKQRQDLLAGLLFWIAKSWVFQGGRSTASRKEAQRVWAVCQQRKLISTLEYWEGLIYFKLQISAVIGRAAKIYLRLRWPKSLLAKRSSTFQNTPLPTKGIAEANIWAELNFQLLNQQASLPASK